MKSILSKIPHPDSSIFYKNVELDFIQDPWHFHEEFELILINRGTGKRFVGNHVSNFQNGDLTLIGSNVPHLFRNDNEYYSTGIKNQVSLVYILFSPEFLGHQFFELPEFRQVNKLLQQPTVLMDIEGKTKKWTSRKLLEMQDLNPVKRLLSVLEILVELSNSKELKSLLSYGYTAKNNVDAAKINFVFQFIMKNYKNQVYVKDIAKKLNMSIASFSRYFKHHARKNFSEYVTEVRISNACKELMDGDKSIAEICYSSGFDNQSNFCRHFKKYTNILPKEYRKRFLENAR
jgi:AraC-like DNA-binding protein